MGVQAGPKTCPMFRQVRGPGETSQASGLRFAKGLPQPAAMLPRRYFAWCQLLTLRGVTSFAQWLWNVPIPGVQCYLHPALLYRIGWLCFS